MKSNIVTIYVKERGGEEEVIPTQLLVGLGLIGLVGLGALIASRRG